MRSFSYVMGGVILLLAACSDPAAPVEEEPPPKPECESDADCSGDTPLCDPGPSRCVELPLGHELGLFPGGSVVLTPIHEPTKLREPVDLEFNPARPNELWTVNKGDLSILVIFDPGTPESSFQRLKDLASSHFMNRPPALAFGAKNTWGTCGDSDNGNGFIGPTLYSDDLELFTSQNPDTGLGSHLDMLHSTKFCRGIAHERDNVYWVFNGELGSIDKYDFHEDHGPGWDDHSDGEIYRYVDQQLLGVEDVSSHVFFRQEDQHLYIAETGRGRVLKLDTTSGTVGKSFSGNEPVQARKYVDDATLTELVAPGLLVQPSGLEIRGEAIFVSDAATGRIHAFDLAGEDLGSFDTGLGAGALSGLTFGPDGKIYLADRLTSRVWRLDATH